MDTDDTIYNYKDDGNVNTSNRPPPVAGNDLIPYYANNDPLGTNKILFSIEGDSGNAYDEITFTNRMEYYNYISEHNKSLFK